MEFVFSKQDKPISADDNSGQLSFEDPSHPGANSGACCVPHIDYCVGESNHADPATDHQMEVSNSLTPATHSAASPVCHTDRDEIITAHPKAPVKRHILSRKRGGQRLNYRRNMIGTDDGAAVDAGRHKMPYRVQHRASMTSSGEECHPNNFDNSHSRGDVRNNDIHVVENNSDEDSNIVDVEYGEDCAALTCDADNLRRNSNRNAYLLPTSQLFAFIPNVQNPPLPADNGRRNLSNVAKEEDSDTGCARLNLRADKYVSSRKRRRLPHSKRVKFARNNRCCLRFDDNGEDSDNQELKAEDKSLFSPLSSLGTEDRSLLSPTACFSRLSLSSACPKPRLPTKIARRRLFAKDGSSRNTYFYNLAASTNHFWKSNHEDVASKLNDLIQLSPGQLSPDSLSSRDNNSSRQASLDLHSCRHPSSDSDNASVESRETDSQPGLYIEWGKK